MQRPLSSKKYNLSTSVWTWCHGQFENVYIMFMAEIQVKLLEQLQSPAKSPLLSPLFKKKNYQSGHGLARWKRCLASL